MQNAPTYSRRNQSMRCTGVRVRNNRQDLQINFYIHIVRKWYIQNAHILAPILISEIMSWSIITRVCANGTVVKYTKNCANNMYEMRTTITMPLAMLVFATQSRKSAGIAKKQRTSVLYLSMFARTLTSGCTSGIHQKCAYDISFQYQSQICITYH